MAIKNLLSNLIFILSGVAVAALLFQPASMWVGIVMIATLWTLLISLFKSRILQTFFSSKKIVVITSVALSVVAGIWLRLHFLNVWDPKIYDIASIVLMLAAIPFLFSTFSIVILEIVDTLEGVVVFRDVKSILGNYIRNSYFIVSFIAFLILNMKNNAIGFISLAIAVLTVLIIMSQVDKIIKYIDDANKYILLYSTMSAAGICFFSQNVFTKTFERKGLSLLLGGIAFISIFILMSIFLEKLLSAIKGAIKDLSRIEVIVYLALIFVLWGLTIYAFRGSFALWGGDVKYDLVFSSDTPVLVKNNAYMWIGHSENDLRQPLFAVFASPIIGAGYLFSIPFHSALVTACFMNMIQIVVLVASMYLLSIVIDLCAAERICFVVLFSSTFTGLLFSLMMEQYQVSFFYLMVALYRFHKEGKISTVLGVAAGGTLITNIMALPFATFSKGLKSVSEIVKESRTAVISLIALIVAFARFDIVINISSKTDQLSTFAGNIGIGTHIKQFFYYVATFFLAPSASSALNSRDAISWQQDYADESIYVVLGVIILAICLSIVVINKHNPIMIFFGMWLVFGFVMLGLFGWGAAEGKELYELYFGWPFIALCFAGLQKLSIKVRCRGIVYIVSLVCIVLFGIINFKAISELLEFLFMNYPR